MSNPFIDLGEKQARKHKHRVAVAKAEKETRDEELQFTLYRRGRRAELTMLLSNPMIGDKVGALIKFLKSIGPDSAPALVDYIEKSEWLRNADENTRQTILSYIAAAIMRVRVQRGLAPFDDALNDEPLTAFQLCRQLLMGV